MLVEVRERNLAHTGTAPSPADPSTSTVKNEENPPTVKMEDGDAIKSEAKTEEESSEPVLLSQAAEEKLLSLDYVHGMTDEQAMKELESFKGVGPKSKSSRPAFQSILVCRPRPRKLIVLFHLALLAASCVLLFCLARDSFAVDTHVFRLSQQLNWVPAKATRSVVVPVCVAALRALDADRVLDVYRQTTYEHLDVRIPAELRYPLHVLLIA